MNIHSPNNNINNNNNNNNNNNIDFNFNPNEIVPTPTSRRMEVEGYERDTKDNWRRPDCYIIYNGNSIHLEEESLYDRHESNDDKPIVAEYDVEEEDEQFLLSHQKLLSEDDFEWAMQVLEKEVYNKVQ